MLALRPPAGIGSFKQLQSSRLSRWLLEKPLLLFARPVRTVRSGRASRRLVGRRVRSGPWLLQLGRRRSVRLRIAKRHGLRHGGRARTLLRRAGGRTTEVVRPINPRRDEEENLERILSDSLSLEEIAEDWNAGDAWRALA